MTNVNAAQWHILNRIYFRGFRYNLPEVCSYYSQKPLGYLVEDVNEMTEKQKNFFAVWTMLCLIFTGSVGIGYLLTEIDAGNYNLSEQQIAAAQAEPEKLRTFAWKEQYALCAMYQLDCKATPMTVDESVEAQIKQFTLHELAEVYPLPEWEIKERDTEVTIMHNLEGLCDVHRSIYHLGSNATGQYVAVYYGPSDVGEDAGTFLVTDVPVSRLSTEQKAALSAGEYEYRSQDDLIAMLDNLSEL